MKRNQPTPWDKNQRETQTGDSKAAKQLEVSTLYSEHNDALLRYLSVRLSSQQEAAEVAQEAYIRLLSLDKPDTVSYLRAFLYKTADNIAIDRLRRRQRTEAIFDSQESEQECRSEVQNPERQLSARQSISQLRVFVAELPPKCQKAFLMYKFQEREYGEIAESMGLSENMIRKYVLRALAHLKERMAQ
ncbi:RNA polymerase sigma factor [Dasania marina]|uniref:RNA polymerase sigma factor n=1 Tax=Dasania marina TaxID=471499 RepID=UPI00035C917C|nr:RNA polymerase sigma factor [Dasania marina]